MKINVISPVYKNQAVNFNGFVVNFNIEGKGVLNFDENQKDDVVKVFETHPNIYEGDKLPEVKSEKVNTTTTTEVNTSSEVEVLKESNKKLALENANLKKENETLKKAISELKADEDKEKTSEEDSKEEEVEKSADEDTTSIKDDLNKKTLAQLKELLNTEDFLPFKEEWKGLTKKEDIVNYILTKITE